MHYGHEPHIASPDDLTVIHCSCGWRSAELSHAELSKRGLPWYCDACGERAPHFIRFHPRERERAQELLPPVANMSINI